MNRITTSWRWLTSWYSEPYFKASEMVANTDNQKSDQDIEKMNFGEMQKLRENVRWLRANNTDVASIINAFIIGTVGERINIQSRIKNTPESPDQEKYNDQIEEYIREWKEIGNCETSGRWHFDGLLRAIVAFAKQDGGILIRHHINPEWDIPYRVELIEVGMIDVTKNDKDARLENGIKKDIFNRISGIYIYDNQDRLKSTLISSEDVTLFGQTWLSVSQYSPITPLAPLIPKIDTMSEYTEAEVKSAKNRANNGVFWATSLYDSVIKAFSKAKAENVELSAKNAKVIMEKISENGTKPDGVTPLPAEDKIYANSSDNDTIFDVLNKDAKKSMASGAGLSPQIVHRDVENVNYTSAKYNGGLDGISLGIEFDDLANKVLKNIMHRVIKAGATVEHLVLPNYFKRPSVYHKIEFMRTHNIDIEPLKTANSNKIKLETGEETMRSIQAKKGNDWKQVIDDKLEEEEYELLERKKRGLPVVKVDQLGNEISEEPNEEDDE